MARSKSKFYSIDYEKVFGKPIKSRPTRIDIMRLKKMGFNKKTIRAPAKILYGLRYKGMRKDRSQLK